MSSGREKSVVKKNFNLDQLKAARAGQTGSLLETLEVGSCL